MPYQDYTGKSVISNLANSLESLNSRLIENQVTRDCALVADVTASREGTEKRRKELSLLLEKARIELNKVFAEGLKKEVVFSSGDSVQGLFHTEQDAFLYARLLQKIFSPEILRVGIGIGSSISAWGDKDSNYSTGVSYIYANQALEYCKNNGLRIRLHDIEINDINIILEATSLMRDSFTEYHEQLDLMIETIHPFVSINMDSSQLNEALLNIIEYKLSLETFDISKKRNNDADRIANFITTIKKERLLYYKPIHLDLGDVGFGVLVSKNDIQQVNVRGMVSDLALLTDTSKSNMSQRISSANISKIREYDAYVYYKMGEVE